MEYKVEDENDAWLKGVDVDEKFATGGKKASAEAGFGPFTRSFAYSFA